MNTEFEFIKGYENLYKINRNGDIYSCKYDIIMSPQEKQDGYLYVNLSKPKSLENNIIKRKKSNGFIHRLLLLQYIDNPENKPEVDHIDRNRHNNSLDNLRWSTRLENRHNRTDLIELLSDEQKEERNNKIKEYKKEWAEKDRREKGMKIKADMDKTKDKKYYSEWVKNKRAKETPEHKEERLIKRREQYKLKKSLNN